MIDLEKAKKEFLKYVENYDETKDMIRLKKYHSLRVMDISVKIAESLNLENEDIKLAGLIGLLHDIARFEQYSLYNTFNDKASVDHGDLGVEILKKNNFIRKFIQEDCYDEIIKTAIKNHNKKYIEKGLDNRALLHCKIIRDADKTDIFKVLVDLDYVIQDINNIKISEEILKDFYTAKNIDYTKIKNKLDKIVCNISYIFDFNYKYGLEVLAKQQYIEKIINKVQAENNIKIEEFDKIIKFANEYIQERFKK